MVRTDSRVFDSGRGESLAIAIEELAHVAGDLVHEQAPCKVKLSAVIKWAPDKKAVEIYYLNFRKIETIAYIEPWWKILIRKLFDIR